MLIYTLTSLTVMETDLTLRLNNAAGIITGMNLTGPLKADLHLPGKTEISV